MSCDPGADKFIEDHFKDCVYNVRDYIGFCLGLAAIAFWLVAQLPQYYRNYKTKSSEALSPWFLAQWLLGDTFNLIGALLQGQQLPTTVYTAMYFVIADMFMMMQFIYYGALQRRREQVLKIQARRRHHHRRHHHQQQHHTASSRERDALLGQPAHSSTGPSADGGVEQQQQGQGQLSGRPSQQDRRRVPHQTVGVYGSQQMQSGLEQAPHASSKQQLQQQDSSLLAPAADSGPEDDSGNCSNSACSQASDHSSSKGPRPSSRTTSPSRQPSAATAGAAAQPVSCIAAAAAPYARVAPGMQVPFGTVHWGGVRSVVAVAVLVSMGVISLLPGSATRGFVPIGLSAGPPAAVQGQQGSSASARAMQSGLQQQQQQQGSSIHLQTLLLLASPAAASTGGDSSSSNSSGSSSSNGGSGSKSWARQRRVGDEDEQHDWSFIVGTGLGYVASILYLCSRVSQIHKNYTRKSSEGLALVMFIMAVCANLCTGTSIILRTFTWQELKEQLPWIIGSLGTISLDMIILWQSSVYSKNALLLLQQQQQGVGSSGDGVPVHSTRHHRHHQHTAVDMPGGTAGSSRGQPAVAGVSSGAAVLNGMPLAPHPRGAMIGRRHVVAAAAAGDLVPDGADVVVPLVGSSSHL